VYGASLISETVGICRDVLERARRRAPRFDGKAFVVVRPFCMAFVCGALTMAEHLTREGSNQLRGSRCPCLVR